MGMCVREWECARVGGGTSHTERGGDPKVVGEEAASWRMPQGEGCVKGTGTQKRGLCGLSRPRSRVGRVFFFSAVRAAHLGQVDASRLVVCRLQAHREVRRGEVTRRVESRRVHRVVRAVRFAVCFAVCFAVRSARCSARCSVHWNQFRLSPARPRSRRICVRRAGWAGEKSGRWSYGRGVLWS